VEAMKDKGGTLKLLEERNMMEKNNKTKKVKLKKRKKTIIFLSPPSFTVPRSCLIPERGAESCEAQEERDSRLLSTSAFGPISPGVGL
jgi:hypothetical protein